MPTHPREPRRALERQLQTTREETHYKSMGYQHLVNRCRLAMWTHAHLSTEPRHILGHSLRIADLFTSTRRSECD